MRINHCLVGLGAALLALAPAEGRTRAYTLDDLVSLEQLGRVQGDPAGRWLVIERVEPWRTAARYDAPVAATLTSLLRVDLARPGPARPLLQAAEGTGYLAGPMAPDGARMLVHRVSARTVEAGVLDLESGKVRWLGLTPEFPVYGRAAQWRSARELLLIARPDGDTPRRLSLGWEARARLPRLWAQQAAGAEPTVSAIGSGRFRELRPRSLPSRLIAIDVVTGRQETLASGEFIDLELSRGGRYAALIENREEGQPAATDRAYIAFPTRRRALVVVELGTGKATEPLGPADVALGLLTWSPGSEELLVAVRRPDLGWNGRALMRISPARTRATPLDVTGLDLVMEENREGAVFVRADWLAGDPIVLARPRAGGRADWWRLGPNGPVNLTARLPVPPGELAALRSRGLVINAGGHVWLAGPNGDVRQLARDARALIPTQDAGTRLQRNPRVGPRPGAVVGPSSAPEVVFAGGGHIAVMEKATGGLLRLRLGARSREPLLTLNAGMADVRAAMIVPVRHRGTGGEPLTSWLYLPPAHRSGDKLPLVVIPYRGLVLPRPHRMFEPSAFNTFMNAQVLVAAGYAVLTPSLPYDERRAAPTEGAAADILAAVDAALARGDLDGGRVALFGQSFGALTAVAAAAQSDRFATVIAVSGTHNEISNWGAFGLHGWVVPEDGAPAMGPAGKVERSQAHLMAPPWAAPDRYVAASNLFAADRITAPVLIVHGDLDDLRASQAQELFTALYRQGKDAALLTYWGEGHAFESPANIRSLYEAMLQWLARTMPAASPSLPSAEPTPPQSQPR